MHLEKTGNLNIKITISNIMKVLQDYLSTIEHYVGSNSFWFPYVLLFVGIFFTIYLKFPPFRYFRHGLRLVSGKYDEKHHKGDTTHFQALATALSGTIGMGNIAGVAFAIFIGGPAAIFWMLVCAAFGMTTKLVEITLSHKYREVDAQGYIVGGPMHYMKNKLKMPRLGAIFALLFIISAFGSGVFPEINAIANSLHTTAGIENSMTGTVLTVLLAIILLGGIKRIAKVTEKLVPFMSVLYFFGAILVIGSHYENIIPSIKMIFTNVFTGTAAMGGFLGAGVSFAFKQGLSVGLFSNEAGRGSAPIAHASARTDEPAAEGIVGMLGPFIDTFIVCNLTALAILCSGVWKEKLPNQFQFADMEIIQGVYDDHIPQQQKQLASYIQKGKELELYTGNLTLKEGKIQQNVSVIHARSLAEGVRVYNRKEKTLYTGVLKVIDGKIINDQKVIFKGKSLIHSAPLTTEAFARSPIKGWGRWLVSLILIPFAFSTTLAWGYYGGRCVVYLWGTRYLLFFRLLYCICFFIGSIIDTTNTWIIANITMGLAALPNLIGIFLLRKDMKDTINEYWKNSRKDISKKVSK